MLGFLHSSVSKQSACSAGDPGSILRLGRSPGEGNGNPLQYSCLENPMDRGAWQAAVHGVTRVGHDLVTKPPPPCILMTVLGYSVVSYSATCQVCSLPGSSVHGIFQAIIQEQGAIFYSRESSQPRNRTCISSVSCICRWVLYHSVMWKALYTLIYSF